MEPESEKTLTLAHRTRKNLDYIYAKKEEGEDVEEFTQLLNSMLGLVINLREDYFKGSHITWSDVIELTGMRSIKPIHGKPSSSQSPELETISSFSQLVTKLRHAFAHNCFDLRIEKKIVGVTVWNVRPNKENKPRNRVWEADFSEQELKDLAYLILNYLEKSLGES